MEYTLVYRDDRNTSVQESQSVIGAESPAHAVDILSMLASIPKTNLIISNITWEGMPSDGHEPGSFWKKYFSA